MGQAPPTCPKSSPPGAAPFRLDTPSRPDPTMRSIVLLSLLALLPGPLLAAAELSVAAAANFAAPLRELASRFEAQQGGRLQISLGGTGQLYAQIRNGAPFEVLLAADDATPARLEREGLAVAGSRFTYATGQLVLWSARADLVDAQGQVLQGDGFQHLALANARLSPYGQASHALLARLDPQGRLQARLVEGQNIAQVQQFIASGNAELGLVAYSQVFVDGRLRAGSAWPVPPHLYPPLQQDAVLLRAGQHNPLAGEFLAFLRSPASQALIRRYGYHL